MDRVTVGHTCPGRQPLAPCTGSPPRSNRASGLPARAAGPAPPAGASSPPTQPPQTTPHNHSPRNVREPAVVKFLTETPGTETTGTVAPGSPAGTPPATATRPGPASGTPGIWRRRISRTGSAVPPAQLPARPVVGTTTAYRHSGRPVAGRGRNAH